MMLNIKVKFKDDDGDIQIMQSYIPVTDFKVIKGDENKEVKNKEIKRVIYLLKDRSSDPMPILEDLNTILNKSIEIEKDLCKMYVEMGFLSSVMKIFEDEKKGDEKIIDVLVLIIHKIKNRDFKREGKDLFKSKDAIDALYDIMFWNFNIKRNEDAMKIIIIISKKYPSDVMNIDKVKDSCFYVLPSNKEYSNESKKYIYILFKELIKEGIIKKGEEGSEIIEEILYIAEMVNETKDLIHINKDNTDIINDFIIFTKEKGFEGNLYENKNDIIVEFIYFEWKELVFIDVCYDPSVYSRIEILKEEDIEKIKKYIQLKFISYLNKYMVENSTILYYLDYFNTKKNGLFLYLYLPLLFKIYHFEERLPLFLKNMKNKYKDNYICYKYIIKLYNEIIERMMKEEKEIEMNEENIIIIIFLWTIKIEEGRKNNEIECLINSTVKVLEWLGRIEEKEEEIKEKEKELIKKEEKNEKGIKEIINRKEIIINKLLNLIIGKDYDPLEETIYIIKKDKRIIKVLLEIVKNHIKNERYLINKGNKKRIIEYIIYSYNEGIDTSYLLSLPCCSFPFCNNSILFIMFNIYNSFIDNNNNNNKELIMRELFVELIDLLNNYIDIIKILNESDIKKEIEKEILIEWKKDIIYDVYKKIYLDWSKVHNTISSCLQLVTLSSFDNETLSRIKRMIAMVFNHYNYYECNYENEKEKNEKEMKEIKIIKPFILDKEKRRDFIYHFLSSFSLYEYSSIFNIYYLINNWEEEWNIISIYMKELSGEVVDRIKKKERNSVLKERRRFERERMYEIYENILKTINVMMKNSFNHRTKAYLGWKRNEEEYVGKEEEIKECRDYILDVIEEEDMRECLIIYLKHSRFDNDTVTNKHKYNLSLLSVYSNNTLYYLLSVYELK